jgi:hypothetical protein
MPKKVGQETPEVTAKSIGEPDLLDETIAQADRYRKLFLLGVIDIREWAKGNNELRARLGLEEKKLPEHVRENEDVILSIESPNKRWMN